MIALFDNDGNRLAVTYNGLTLNDPGDDPDSTYELNTAGSSTNMTMISDDNPTGDGSEMYEARKVSRIIRLDGVVRAKSLAELYDREKALAAAFDPAKISHEHPGADFLALDFSTPTEDTTNYATGLVASRYYARPRQPLELLDSSYTGYAKLFSAVMLMKDPRRYLQATSSVSVNKQSGSGSGATGTVTADNRKADYRSWPTLSLTTTSVFGYDLTITNVSPLGTKSLVLNLGGFVSSTDVLGIDMATCSITKNGSPYMDAYVSGDFWEIEPGLNEITTLGHSVSSAITITWRPAFCV